MSTSVGKTGNEIAIEILEDMKTWPKRKLRRVLRESGKWIRRAKWWPWWFVKLTHTEERISRARLAISVTDHWTELDELEHECNC